MKAELPGHLPWNAEAVERRLGSLGTGLGWQEDHLVTVCHNWRSCLINNVNTEKWILNMLPVTCFKKSQGHFYWASRSNCIKIRFTTKHGFLKWLVTQKKFVGFPPSVQNFLLYNMFVSGYLDLKFHIVPFWRIFRCFHAKGDKLWNFKSK